MVIFNHLKMILKARNLPRNHNLRNLLPQLVVKNHNHQRNKKKKLIFLDSLNRKKKKRIMGLILVVMKNQNRLLPDQVVVGHYLIQMMVDGQVGVQVRLLPLLQLLQLHEQHKFLFQYLQHFHHLNHMSLNLKLVFLKYLDNLCNNLHRHLYRRHLMP